jgi:DNA-binding transcriptional LysR family regulator
VVGARFALGVLAVMGDPLLVRAGRGLVPSPRGLELRGPVAQLVRDANAVLRPSAEIDVEQLVRTFTLRTSERFVDSPSKLTDR